MRAVGNKSYGTSMAVFPDELLCETGFAFASFDFSASIQTQLNILRVEHLHYVACFPQPCVSVTPLCCLQLANTPKRFLETWCTVL